MEVIKGETNYKTNKVTQVIHAMIMIMPWGVWKNQLRR